MEITLIGICLFLLGLVIGMKIAPARAIVLGSFNGNTGSLGNPEDILLHFLSSNLFPNIPSEMLLYKSNHIVLNHCFS